MKMKLIANYDASGKIHSLTSFNAPSGVSLMLMPRPGHLVAEVEGHGLTGSPGEKELRNLAGTHTIASPVAQVKLAKNRR